MRHSLEAMAALVKSAFLLHNSGNTPPMRNDSAHGVSRFEESTCARPECMPFEYVKGNAAMEIGMTGLGRMGGNMALRLARGGHRVIGFDPNAQVRDEYSRKGLATATS